MATIPTMGTNITILIIIAMIAMRMTKMPMAIEETMKTANTIYRYFSKCRSSFTSKILLVEQVGYEFEQM